MKNSIQPKTQSGFSLLEVMVTVFILSIGLLGMAGLQASSLKLSHESQLRSQATFVMTNIASRIRANPVIGRAGGYDRANIVPRTNPDNRCRGNNTCAAALVATVDLNNWAFNLGQQFPDARATITTTPLSTRFIATITLIWVDTDSENNSTVNAANAAQRTFTIHSVI